MRTPWRVGMWIPLVIVLLLAAVYSMLGRLALRDRRTYRVRKPTIYRPPQFVSSITDDVSVAVESSFEPPRLNRQSSKRRACRATARDANIFSTPHHFPLIGLQLFGSNTVSPRRSSVNAGRSGSNMTRPNTIVLVLAAATAAYLSAFSLTIQGQGRRDGGARRVRQT